MSKKENFSVIGIIIVIISVLRIGYNIFKEPEYKQNFNEDYITERNENLEAISIHYEVEDLYGEKKYKKAISKLKKGLEIENLDKAYKSSFNNSLGVIYESLYMTDSAIYHYKKQTELISKNSAEYYNNLGNIYVLENKTDSAITMFKKAINIDNECFASNNDLGIIYLGMKNSDTINYTLALKYNLKAHEISPQRATNEVLIKNYKLMGQYKKADIHYIKIINSYPENIDFKYDRLLNLSNNIKDETKSTELAKEIIKLDSTYKNNYKIIEILKIKQ